MTEKLNQQQSDVSSEAPRQEQRTTSEESDGFVERRKFTERRRHLVDRRSGFDRRRGPGHRRTEERRAAEEGEMTDEQFDFLMAIDQYKRANQRPFPTWTEVLEVVKAIGYRKVAEPQPLESFRKADKSQPVEVG
ncbi:MAG TPA: hypothetical protein ENN97_03440 [Phycisphaerales bacterium]|nr:hypothetical protein [Phycisphaerales bacterium]